MKKFFLLVSILFLFSNFILASDGAAGSGKPVAIKMRKDYLEEVIKQKLQEAVKNPISFDHNFLGSTFGLKLNVKINDVLLSRGLLAEGASPLGPETAFRYRIIIFGSLEIASISNQGFAEKILEAYKDYFNKILNSYRYYLTDSVMESYKYDNNKTTEHPNFMLKGYFMPKKDNNGHIDESIYAFDFEDFQIHDLGTTWRVEEEALNALKNMAKMFEFKIKDFNEALESANPFLKISMPGNFETESTMIGMDYCTDKNHSDCIVYPISEPPESSFSNNKAGNLIEFRISEDVFYKEVLKKLYAELENKSIPVFFDIGLGAYYNLKVVDDYLYIYFDVSANSLLSHCGMDFEYHYKFESAIENDDEDKIQLTISHSEKSSSSPGLIYYLICKYAIKNRIDSTFKKVSTEAIKEELNNQKSNLKKLANDINLKNYKIQAAFDTGRNYGDIVLSVVKESPKKDDYLSNFNWVYSDSNNNNIQNINDPCWYSDGKEDCDIDGDGIQDHVDNKVFKAESQLSYSKKDGALHGEKTCSTNRVGLFHITTCAQDKEVHYGEYFDVDGTLYMKELNNNPKTYLSSYYCYCGNTEEYRTQCKVTSTCGEHHGNPGQVVNTLYGKNTWQPMYNKNISSRNNKPYKKGVGDKKINNNTGIYATKTSGKWDWQKDLEDVYGISNLAEWDVQNIIQCDGETLNEKECYMEHYKDFNAARVSFAPSKKETNNENDYITSPTQRTLNEAKQINPEYFENYFVTENDAVNKRFNDATKHKWALSWFSYFPLIKWKDIVTEYEIDNIVGYWLYYPYERLNDFLNPWLIDLTGPVENPGMPMPEASWHVYDMILTPDALFLERVEHGADTQQVFTFDNNYMYYSLENGNFFITQSLYNVSQKDRKEVVNGISLNAGSFVSYNGAVFAAGNLVQNNIMSQRTQENNTLLNDDHIYDNVFVKISENDENYELERLADIPGLQSLTLKLFISDSKLNIATFSTSGDLKFFTYNLEDSNWSEIGSFNFSTGSAPLISSLTASEKNVFFATLEPGGTFLYEFNAESGIKKVIRISEEKIPFTKIAAFKDEVVIADLRKIKEGSVGIYSLKDGILNFKDTELKMIDFTLPNYDGIEKLCVYEKEGLILPGITNRFNKCNLSDNYNYKSKLFFDYKYSLAGYENSLYLGGLTGIRRMEIGENGKLTKKEMLYSGKTKSLAVYKDVLYAANKDEIDLFSISEDGKISRISGLKATDCENLKTENGKLFTAENKQVRIFSLSDPKNPELLKTITVEGSVKDIEILNNKLFVYEETGGCFSKKGTVRIYDVSDSNITQTQNFEKICKKAEFQKSGDKVYLGCKTEIFKVEESSLTKMHGSPKYLRDSYVFDGILYQVFSGTLHKSSVTKTAQPDSDGWF